MKRFFIHLIVGTLLLMVYLRAETGRAMIIFDASGSMWGKVDGVSKIVIARETLQDLLRGWNARIPLGLTVYGHRRKGDCNDIQTLIPIGPLDRQRMIDTVMKIQPRGKTPIARSLRQVASQLKKGEEPATIILISDGKESCDADPCAVARELKASGLNLVAHVIGFHVDRATDRQLACIAKATGGEYFSAGNAAALNRAIKSVAKKVTKVVPIRARPKTPIIRPAQITLVALYESERGGNVKTVGHSGAHWWVWQDGESLYADDDPLDHQPNVSLHSGKARVKLLYPNSSEPQSIERNITVAPGRQRIVFYLKDGRARIEALAEGKKVKSSLHLYPVIGGKVDEINEAGWCMTTPEKGCDYQLPVGEYALRGTCNGRKIDGRFRVVAGQEQLIRLECGESKASR
ncbi:vWA domain-containing protein [Nitratifractor sp.]